MSAPRGGRTFTAQTSREMARRSAEARRLQGLANDPERLADVATADLVRAHRAALRLLRRKDLSANQQAELLKVRVSIDCQLLDRTQGRPRQADPNAATQREADYMALHERLYGARISEEPTSAGAPPEEAPQDTSTGIG